MDAREPLPRLQDREKLEIWVNHRLDEYDLSHEEDRFKWAWQEHARLLRNEIRTARRGDFIPLINALQSPTRVREILVKLLYEDLLKDESRALEGRRLEDLPGASQFKIKRGRGRPRKDINQRRYRPVVVAAAEVGRISRMLRKHYGENINSQLRNHYEKCTVIDLATKIAAERRGVSINTLINYRHRRKRDPRTGRILRPE